MAGKVTVWTDKTSAVSAPSAATDGVDLYAGKPGSAEDGWYGHDVDECEVRIYSTAGSGAMSIDYVRMWGYDPSSARWFPLGTGTDADKGKLNGGLPIGETATDQICHTERINVGGFTRFALSSGTFNGTAPTIQAFLRRIKKVV